MKRGRNRQTDTLQVVNFIIVKRTNFLYKRRFFTYMSLEKSCQNDVLYKKFVRLTLMKLTPDRKVKKEGILKMFRTKVALSNVWITNIGSEVIHFKKRLN